MKNLHIIDRLGGASRVSEMLGINPATGAVSQWRKNGVPDDRLIQLCGLRPDVFSDDERRAVAEKAKKRIEELRGLERFLRLQESEEVAA